MQTPANEFSNLLAASSRTQAQIAADLSAKLRRDIKHYSVSRWASGSVRVPVEVMDAMREIAAPAVNPSPENAVATWDEASERVPLFGYRAEGSLTLDNDSRIGTVALHPAQKGGRAPFAVVVFGDLLKDRLRHGDIAHAVRGRAPAKGEPCIIELKSGEAFLRIFDGVDERTVFASQLNPKKAITWPVADVEALHAVVSVSFGGG